MCGIVGYTGEKNAVEVLVEGLKRLEYRGYDSAGVAAFENGTIKVIKTKGRILDLERKIKKSGGITSVCGIGHTRWATHGEPSDLNSHPHLSNDGRIAVVHNGIIENYLELRDVLTRHGYIFASETDTEVVAHLIEFNLKEEPDLVKAVLVSVSQLRGSYALGVICSDNPERIVAARRDSPLIIGIGEKEMMIASDIPAIISHTKKYMVLNDNEAAVITPGGAMIFNSYGDIIDKDIQTVNWDIVAAEKGGYEHFMIKEIMEEPKALRDTIYPRVKNGFVDISETGIDDNVLAGISKINIVACGSALHAGIVGREVIERLSGVPCYAEVASEFRYRNPIIGKNDLCIIISQSGETADTLAGLREAKKKGAYTLSIVNVVSSSIARESDGVLYTWAGPEISVATTKAYSAQLSVLYMIAVKLGHLKGKISDAEAQKYCEGLMALPDFISESLKLRKQMQYLASVYSNRQNVFFIGRSLDFAAAQEASLKLKEISYIHSEAYTAGELKHGTISLIEEGTLVVALVTEPLLYEKMLSNIREVKARGASVLLVTDRDIKNDSEIFDYYVKLPKALSVFSASLSVIPMQFFAYYIAVYRGCDVDKPRNLAKSVTVE